ncbi:hypothetical protein HETIRDRAFT_412270 [Heterobasidion irregulare TC 32-1]|uniref:Uncharacterized protein n=1 Tax=Heterobasidion irregulare (strain TC 32-1) TaxID=747525 RepID=W4JT36_HETIT|nr:uncharacterized protein HETIRDRAFT_412270 [Heterobasidion irregulare TC 32-1]ETW76036.1 hypothetical protein HETIRDRAFT_412270 [Heterobasidion irregulare TC 32-1]
MSGDAASGSACRNVESNKRGMLAPLQSQISALAGKQNALRCSTSLESPNKRVRRRRRHLDLEANRALNGSRRVPRGQGRERTNKDRRRGRGYEERAACLCRSQPAPRSDQDAKGHRCTVCIPSMRTLTQPASLPAVMQPTATRVADKGENKVRSSVSHGGRARTARKSRTTPECGAQRCIVRIAQGTQNAQTSQAAVAEIKRPQSRSQNPASALRASVKRARKRELGPHDRSATARFPVFEHPPLASLTYLRTHAPALGDPTPGERALSSSSTTTSCVLFLHHHLLPVSSRLPTSSSPLVSSSIDGSVAQCRRAQLRRV